MDIFNQTQVRSALPEVGHICAATPKNYVVTPRKSISAVHLTMLLLSRSEVTGPSRAVQRFLTLSQKGFYHLQSRAITLAISII